MNGWLLVAGDFTPLGGMDLANLSLARFLADRGPVHLVTHRAWNDLISHPNVIVHQVPRPLGRHMLGSPLLEFLGRKWARRLTRAGFRVIVNGGNCLWSDVNWIHYVHAARYDPPSGGWIRRVKSRVHHESSRRAERSAIQTARVVVCNSRRTACDVVNRLGVDPDRVRIVYLGVDPDRFPRITPAERSLARLRLGWDHRPRVGFVGQLGNRVKGFETLYAAWRDLCRDSQWDANLAVVGAGADLPRWKKQTAADGLDQRIQFLGYRTDIPDILAACDSLAHPARHETYGMAVHEALCRGLPVVVSSTAGVSEKYPPELADMILQDPEDVGELANRLKSWRLEMESWSRRVSAFSDVLRAYTWQDMATEFVQAVTDADPAMIHPERRILA